MYVYYSPDLGSALNIYKVILISFQSPHNLPMATIGASPGEEALPICRCHAHASPNWHVPTYQISMQFIPSQARCPFSGIQWGDKTVHDITDRTLSGYELKKQLLRPLVNIIHCHTGLAIHTNIQTMSDNQTACTQHSCEMGRCMVLRRVSCGPGLLKQVS